MAATFNGGNNTSGAATTAASGFTVYANTQNTSGGLTLTGNGDVTLSGANTYGGGTTVSSGTLNLDLSGRSGHLNVGTISVGASATLEVYNTTTALDTTAFTTGTTVTGSGTIAKTGPGYLDFWSGSSIKNFSGQILVQAGTLANNGSDWSSGSGQMNMDIASGAAFDVRTGTTLINNLTNSGTVYCSYTTGGTLSVGNNNGSSTFGGVIEDGATP